MKIEFDNALNEAGWVLVEELRKFGDVNGHMFNNIKPSLKLAIERYLSESCKTQPIPQQEAKMNIDKLATQVEGVEWDGNGLPPVGVECEYKDGDEWYEVKVKYLSEWVIVIESLKSQGKLIDIKGTEISIDYSRFNDLKFRKPESPEEKEKRETIDKICWDVKSIKLSQAIALYEAGYRLND